MKKITIYVVVSLLCAMQCINAQKLPVNTLVNTLYKKNSKIFNLDTLLYLNNREPDFFIIDSTDTSNTINVISFLTNKELDDYINIRNNLYLFDIRIIDIGINYVKLDIEMSKTTGEKVYGHNLLNFVDGQVLECKLNKNQKWVLSRTLEVKDN